MAPGALTTMRALNFARVSGNQAKVGELRRLLEKIEKIDFTACRATIHTVIIAESTVSATLKMEGLRLLQVLLPLRVRSNAVRDDAYARSTQMLPEHLCGRDFNIDLPG